MKIGILSSSRADYGIYKPLLKGLAQQSDVSFEMIAFGMHLSEKFGMTVNEIEADGWDIIHKVLTPIEDDSIVGISSSYGETIKIFSKFWKEYKYDLILCLGDRYEMSAAVQSTIPLQLKLAHIHGGETTLGAIDNIYRHQITLASHLHFTSTENHRKKVISLTGNQDFVFNVGSLSLSEIDSFKPVSKIIFLDQFNISSENYALVTFHPETVDFELNEKYAQIVCQALEELCDTIHIVISMPNADTSGDVYRKTFLELKRNLPNKFTLVENFGKDNYFNAMYHSKLLIGNSSSGIIEAASFNKYVINVGDRQKGRDRNKNIIDSRFSVNDITNYASTYVKSESFTGSNIYYKKSNLNKIISTLKEFYDRHK